ncbi:MAG: hypothetical protein ACI9TV_002057 [Sulfurimonas sp.]|jgi:hypothetical protein|uniref:hypothetical protein n=1 Tax=Sulfurimonas sp. TaxID=2022749 RepID=UPI0039E26F39
MEFRISKKPIDIDSDTRILYLSIMMLFIIFYTGYGKQKTISLLKIHLLLWVIKSVDRQNRLLESLENNCDLSIGLWNINIKNNSILTILVKDKLCGFNGSKYFLTEEGIKFVSDIKELKALDSQQQFLKNIGSKLSDKNVDKLKSLWS